MGVKGFVEGGIASIVAGCSTHPLDLIKVRMQLQGESSAAAATLRPALAFHPTGTHTITFPTTHAPPPPPRVGILNIGAKIITQEGVPALFSGVSATVLRQTLYSTTRMGLYDIMKTKWTDPNTGTLSLTRKISAGLLAGGIGAAVGNPADVAMVRMQADGRLPISERRNYKSVLDAIQRMVKTGDEPTVDNATITSTDPAAVVHKTKTIQFFGRSTPIILQNDNGPCPLLSICNVLLLRNQLNLNPDISEVSQEKLLSLVAERLIDSNSNNNNNKDEGVVENQQQNISDAIDLLPRLTTGIDVNIKFRRIDDFEFTSECAIFDLLDIPLYHGWLVDPQDHEMARTIGSKSYNTLMGDLVFLETWKMENVGKDKSDEDCIDFAAATTAALGVPSPSLSRGRSFDESPRSTSSEQQTQKPRKGDAEEDAELLRVLKLSESDSPSNSEATAFTDKLMSSDENVHMLNSTSANSVHVSEGHNKICTSLDVEPSASGSDEVNNYSEERVPLFEEQAASHTLIDDTGKPDDQLIGFQHEEASLSNYVAKYSTDTLILDEATPSSGVKDAVQDQKIGTLSSPTIHTTEGLQRQNVDVSSGLIADHVDLQPASGGLPSIEAIDSLTPSIENGEPIYEGEECIMDPGKTICEDREPVYEGEMVLAEQVDNKGKDASDASPEKEISLRQGELINFFLKSNASQLTFCGLFCLQEGLKERELCVFFRNNHFSTMFKMEGELYLLATDQGYMNQPDLVWEKLNEVNGDTLFMTSNFKEFKLETSSNGTWDQQNAVASTADYLASIDHSATDGSNVNSDLQLAIALQQQEFEQQQQQQQQQHQQQRNPPQPPSVGSSRLITGPQVSRSSAKATSSTPKRDQKSKDKSNCKVM